MFNASVSHNSNADSIIRKIDRFQEEFLEQIASEAADTARASMGPPGPGPRSLPGEPPRRQTNALYEGITHESYPEQAFSHVTSERNGSSEVPGYLEHGTRRMAARPYMSPAYERARHEMARIAQEAKRRAGL